MKLIFVDFFSINAECLGLSKNRENVHLQIFKDQFTYVVVPRLTQLGDGGGEDPDTDEEGDLHPLPFHVEDLEPLPVLAIGVVTEGLPSVLQCVIPGSGTILKTHFLKGR